MDNATSEVCLPEVRTGVCRLPDRQVLAASKDADAPHAHLMLG